MDYAKVAALHLLPLLGSQVPFTRVADPDPDPVFKLRSDPDLGPI